MSETSFRLPTNVTPVHYDLTLRTDLKSLTFDGSASIELEVHEDSSTIAFNAHDGLVLGDVTVIGTAQRCHRAMVSERANERVTLSLDPPLPAESKALVNLNYSSQLRTSMGYHYSSYESDGQTVFYTATESAPIYARAVFPCMDEPSLKATFAIHMISRIGTVNLSNMPVESEELCDSVNTKSGVLMGAYSFLLAKLRLGGGSGLSGGSSGDAWKTTNFKTSPKMSTYLVAFANGPFEFIESSYKSPISGMVRPLRIYATPDIIQQTQWALDVTTRVVPLYEKMFDIEFPLPKLDTVIASNYLGAAENWGLITGRASDYLLDPSRADISSRKAIAAIQTHEVAHQWFGDVVTMEWWDNLWLNEGFATIMGDMVMLSEIEPDWNVYAEFGAKQQSAALALDARKSSHPIEVAIEDPNMIGQIFDSLSYSKGGSVMRMLSAYLGEEAFLKGVSVYLKKHLFGNTVTNDLWDGISEATGRPIQDIMDNWIRKTGYPMITVSESSGGIHVRQDRFLLHGAADEADNETIWQIPLSITASGDDQASAVHRDFLMIDREIFIELDVEKPYKLNGGNTGFYRVLYDADRAAVIAAELGLQPSVFVLEDRIGFLSDSLALAQASYSKTSDFLKFVHLFRHDKEHLGWRQMTNGLIEVSSLFWEDKGVQNGLQAFQASLFSPLVKRLGYDNDDSDHPDIIQLRTLAITQAANAGVIEVIHELQRRYAAFSSGEQGAISPDLLLPTFKTVVQHGGLKEWEAMKNIFRGPSTPNASAAALNAMASTRDPNLIEKTLAFLKSDVFGQDLYRFWKALRDNPFARRIVAKHFFQNFDHIASKYDGDVNIFSRVLAATFDRFCTKADIEEVEAFFKERDTRVYSLALAQTLEIIQINTRWRAESLEDVETWLTKWRLSEGV
ncbi:hypothetical protein SISNIDRAFT_438916 [Sistotremastrum niveocremeum HHB9708]|uniref:Aminopeptidase n=1 Tax=Sistotremastrum niveocremeum HHB9708 TaxID=1314777 RepID=A0A164WVK1_9AGAM|nr:hypothetical protein SISNIDRAFT_438916 [Sistotremastrum niveocremeum HHB9708]